MKEEIRRLRRIKKGIEGEINIDNEIWSKAFKAYKKGKNPVDLVIEGVLSPDEAKYTYEKFVEMAKNFKVSVKPELSRDMWSVAFKAFREGKKPMDLVLEGIMNPEEANYAYEKYIELIGMKRREEFEIPDSLIALFLIGSFLSFVESLLLRMNVDIYDPLQNLLLIKFSKEEVIIMNGVLSVAILIFLVLISSYFVKNKKISMIFLLLFCIYKFIILGLNVVSL
jgi:hypothetical protein